ncbi:uncharacterized protein LOC134249106, partial [Saccostrea cucullata]|uniref:uncharacterized protein LOC134249106 n=1 Tax=Saccostrea cuccullata TaxID=36930 RepID=UPI002ED1A3E9
LKCSLYICYGPRLSLPVHFFPSSGYAESRSNCPPEAVQTVRNCISSSIPSFAPSKKYNLKREIEIMWGACRSSSLAEASNCVKRVMDKCTGMTDEEQNLQRLFSHKDIEYTYRYFCDNFDLYEKHIGCIQDQHQAATNCSRPQMESFRRKITAKSPIEVMILSSCSTHQIMTECLLEPVNQNCGDSAAMFLEHITLNQRPPVCHPLTPKYSSLQNDQPNSATTSAVTSRTIFGAVLFIFVWNLLPL